MIDKWKNFKSKDNIQKYLNIWTISIFGYFAFIVFFIRLFGNAFIDDTYITLLYARNLSEHFEWGAYHGIPGNSASSPLNVILLAAINRLVENPEIVVLVLAILIQFLFFIVSCKIGEKLSLSKLFPFSISFIFLCNPLIISTMGLESMLLILIFFLTILFYLKDSVYNLGICIGLLYLTRPDAVLLALPFCIMRRGIKGRFLPPIIAFAIVSPWLYFSWKYMGSFFPDTLFIKKIEKSWGDFNFRNGWVLYYAKFPVEFAFSLSPLLLSAPFLFSLKKPFNKTFKIAILIGASGAIHYFAYSKLRVPPYHWYYAPSLFCLITAPTFLFFGNNPSKKIKYVYVLLLFSLQLAGFNWIATRTNDFSEMPIHTNWSSKNNYKKLANEIDRKLTAKTYIRLYCEIGTIAYFSKNGIFLNEFTDRTEFLKLYRFLQLKNETANPIVSLFIRGMFYNIERIQEEYPMLEKYPLIILGNPPEKDKYELIGQTSSRWSSTWGLYLGKNP